MRIPVIKVDNKAVFRFPVVFRAETVQQQLVVKLVKSELLVTLVELFVIDLVIVDDHGMKVELIIVVEGKEIFGETLVFADFMVADLGPFPLREHTLFITEFPHGSVKLLHGCRGDDDAAQHHKTIF